MTLISAGDGAVMVRYEYGSFAESLCSISPLALRQICRKERGNKGCGDKYHHLPNTKCGKMGDHKRKSRCYGMLVAGLLAGLGWSGCLLRSKPPPWLHEKTWVALDHLCVSLLAHSIEDRSLFDQVPLKTNLNSEPYCRLLYEIYKEDGGAAAYNVITNVDNHLVDAWGSPIVVMAVPLKEVSRSYEPFAGEAELGITFIAWSFGENGVNDYGGKDDLGNWIVRNGFAKKVLAELRKCSESGKAR